MKTNKPLIAIAVDGSPAARAATELGLERAATRKGEVVFLHGNSELAARLFDLD